MKNKKKKKKINNNEIFAFLLADNNLFIQTILFFLFIRIFIIYFFIIKNFIINRCEFLEEKRKKNFFLKNKKFNFLSLLSVRKKNIKLKDKVEKVET